MSIPVRFRQFHKRRNSTNQPPSDGWTEYQCNLISDCSIISPQIRLAGSTASFNPTAFNYAWIPEFSRYYWVANWTFSNACWTASMEVDVLASWGSYIVGAQCYIERAESGINGYIPDAAVPLEGIATSTVTTVGVDDFLASELEEGTIAVSIVSGSASGVYTYLFEWDQAKRFFSALYADNDLLQAIANSLTSPLSYISSVTWLAVRRPALLALSGIMITSSPLIPFGWWNLSVDGIGSYLVTEGSSTVTVHVEFDLPNHPFATTSKWAWLNWSEASRHELVWPPIGKLELDTSKAAGWAGISSLRIKLAVKVDVKDGTGMFTLSSGLTSASYMASGPAELSVQIPVGELSFDLSTLARGLASGIASAATGTVAGGILGGVEAVSGLLGAARGESRGSFSGSFAAMLQPPRIYSTFYDVAGTPQKQIGGPVATVGTLRNYSGFIQTRNAQVSAPATATELSSISNFMDGGFYHE